MEKTVSPSPPKARRWALSQEQQLVGVVLIGALLLRIVLAMIFAGHPTDINNFKIWGMHAVKVGLGGYFLGPDKIWCDYPPLYVYVLGAFSWLYHLFDRTFAYWSGPGFTLAIKLPALLAELGCGALIYKLVRRHARFGVALAAMALYLFNPATNYDTAIAGQMNSVIGLMQLGSLYLLLKHRHASALVLGAMAVLVKPQGLILIPLYALVVMRRKDWKAIGIAAVASLALAFLVTAPFVMPHLGATGVFPWLYEQYTKQADLYPFSSIQAFNLWALTDMWQPDSRLILGVTHKVWGLVLFAGAYLACVIAWWRRSDRDEVALFQAAALIMTAFFLFPTRMHERYLHYTLILGMVPAAMSLRWRWPIALFSFTFLVNVFYELKFPSSLAHLAEVLKQNWYIAFSVLNLILFAFLLILAYWKPTVELPEAAPKPGRLTEKVATWFADLNWQWTHRTRLDKLDWLLIGGLVLVTTALRAYQLGWPYEMVFDEVYHARTANEYLHGVHPTEWVHPPLAKLFIAAGVYLMGMVPLGWRIAPLIAGSLLLPVFYLLARNTIGDRRWSLIATLLLSMDGVYFVQSRMAMTNIFAILFQVGTLTCFWMYWKNTDRHARMHHGWLAATGLCLSLALATRWTSLWAFGFVWLCLGVRYLLPIVWREPAAITGQDVTLAKTGETPSVWRWQWPDLKPGFWLWAILYLIGLPLLVYAISYIPYKLQGHTWWEIVKTQGDIWRYHANLRDPHPYYSAWYSWPFLYRPTWYYFHDFRDGTLSGIDAIGNPAIWWASLVGVGWTLWTGIKRRQADWLYVVACYTFMYLPWMISPRILNYSHYYFEAIPYAIIAITLLVRDLWQGTKAERVVAGLYLATCVGLFAFFYPLLAGLRISFPFYQMHIWFPKWI